MSAPLKIVFLTPGTGSWYCGACMRDHALARALQAAGHQVALLPMYLPLMLDEAPPGNPRGAPVFFGGIAMFLRQKFPWFRHAPHWLANMLDRPRLLRWVARHSHLTSAAAQGDLTLAMLRMDDHRFAPELDPLVAWLAADPPDVLCLSTALQAGLIRGLKRRLGVRVVCCFQGEDSFLDSLPEPCRAACWRELALRVREADVLLAPSRFYAGLMARRLGPVGLAIDVLPNGIILDAYRPRAVKPGPPVIGYLARLCREKGLEVMVEAFIHLRTVLGHPDARLELAGTTTADNQPLITAMRQRLAAAGLADQVRWWPNISRADKLAMLGGLSLFSVPAIYQEAFGLYVVEALASGVPVVQPARCAFPEIIAQAGVGVLVPVANGPPVASVDDRRSESEASSSVAAGHGLDDGVDGHRPPLQAVHGPLHEALAQAWYDLLQDPGRMRGMAERSRRAAEEFYDAKVMGERFVELVQAMLTGNEDNITITRQSTMASI